jgi:ABC-type amino acid transport substrate-binding protein
MIGKIYFGLCAGALLSLALLATSASTAEAGKVESVTEAKKLVVGARQGAPPFGYIDEQGEWVGWSMDVSRALHKVIEKKFGVTLELEFKPITPQTRIPLIVNGTLDWVLGTTGRTVKRDQVIDFSLMNNAVCVQMLHRKSMPFKTYADLGGKRIGVTNGSVEQRMLTAMGKSGEISPAPKLITFSKHSLGFLALDQGKTDVHVTLDVTLHSLKNKAKKPDEWTVHGPELFCIPNGILLPENDSDWKDTVDHALCYLIATGEFDRIYDDWFASDKSKAGFKRAMPAPVQTVLKNQCSFGIEKWLDKK